MRFQTKNIALKGATNTYVSEWKTMQPDFWTASAEGNYLPRTAGHRRTGHLNDYVVGDGTSPMWYTGPATSGRGPTRVLELKNGVQTGDGEWGGSTKLEFDTRVLARGLRYRQGPVRHFLRRRELEQLEHALRL